MRLAAVSSRINEVAERYQVPERVNAASQKMYEGMSAAGDAAKRGAYAAYQLARENPRTTIASAIVAATLIGGLLYYMFGDPQKPVERRRKGKRVRARTERRTTTQRASR